MVHFVAADASPAEQGNRYFLVGVAIEISNGTEFDDFYFNTISNFCADYDIELCYPILKAGTVLDRIPSYKIRDTSESLSRELLKNPAIERIHVCIGWYNDEVKLGYKPDKADPMSGISFVRKMLSQYFPVTTLWKYHQSNRNHGVPDEAWIDSIQGKITKSWSYVGNQFDLNVVPHGDITYPSLSTADIIARQLARTLPRNKPFGELPGAAKGWLFDCVNDDEVWVGAESVTVQDRDMIVPDYPYSIHGQLHYPHPVMFIFDDMFKEVDSSLLPETDFHSFAREWAHDEVGSVVNLDTNQLPATIQNGDRIVYTDGTDSSVCDLIQDLNPTKDIEVLSSTEFISRLDR